MLRFTPKYKTLAEANEHQSANGFTLSEYLRGGPFDLPALQLNKKTKMSEIINALPDEMDPVYQEILKTWFDITVVDTSAVTSAAKQQSIIKNVFAPNRAEIEKAIRKEHPRGEGMLNDAYEKQIASLVETEVKNQAKELESLNVSAEQMQREYPKPDGMPDSDYRAMITAKVNAANRGTLVAGVANNGKPNAPKNQGANTGKTTGSNKGLANYMLEGNPTAESSTQDALPKYPNVFAFAIGWLGIQLKQIARYFEKTPAGTFKFMDRKASEAVHKVNFGEDEKLKLAYEASFKGTDKEALIPISFVAKHSTSAAPIGAAGITAYLTSKFQKIKEFFTQAKVEPEFADSLNVLKVDFTKSAEDSVTLLPVSDNAEQNAAIRSANGLGQKFKELLCSPVVIGGITLFSVYEIFKRACPDWNEKVQDFISRIKAGVKHVADVVTDAFSRIKMRGFERAKKHEVDPNVNLTFGKTVTLEGFDEDLCLPVGESKVAQFTLVKSDFDEAMRNADPSSGWRFDIAALSDNRHLISITQNDQSIGHAVVYSEVTDVTIKL